MLAAWCGNAWGGGPWFVVFPLFWLAVIVGVVLILRRRGWDHPRLGSGEAALAERYARGEITEEEYRRRASVLRETGR